MFSKLVYFRCIVCFKRLIHLLNILKQILNMVVFSLLNLMTLNLLYKKRKTYCVDVYYDWCISGMLCHVSFC